MNQLKPMMTISSELTWMLENRLCGMALKYMSCDGSVKRHNIMMTSAASQYGYVASICNAGTTLVAMMRDDNCANRRSTHIGLVVVDHADGGEVEGVWQVGLILLPAAEEKVDLHQESRKAKPQIRARQPGSKGLLRGFTRRMEAKGFESMI